MAKLVQEGLMVHISNGIPCNSRGHPDNISFMQFSTETILMALRTKRFTEVAFENLSVFIFSSGYEQ